MAFESQERLRAWKRDGLFVVPKLFDLERVAALAESCNHVLAKVRAASSDAGHTSTHITGLFDPTYFADRPELLARFVEFASSPDVVGLVHDLGEPDEGPLNLRTAHYFHEPSSRDWDGAWHRDGDEGQLSFENPSRGRTSLRYRIALAEDDRLEIIPGSHRRADTPEELQLRRGRMRNAPNVTGAVRVELGPGDVCVFDTWTIHRGCYRSEAPRRTLDLVFRFGQHQSTYYAALREWRAAARKAE